MPLTITMPVAQLLKKETFDAHLRSEKILASKLVSIKTYQDYASILKTFYGFFCPVENLIRQFITKDILDDIRERRNSLFIIQDLKAINYSIEQLPVCDQLPNIKSSFEALGAMYVLEGSTLGGRMIGKMLLKNTAVAFNDFNLNFFSGYKERTGSKWSCFLSVLNQCEDEADVVAAAANETFDCFTQWMEGNL